MKLFICYLEFFHVTQVCTDINMPFLMHKVDNISKINFMLLGVCEAAAVSNFPQSCIDEMHSMFLFQFKKTWQDKHNITHFITLTVMKDITVINGWKTQRSYIYYS